MIWTRTHGWLDYASAALLYGLPRAMGWHGRPRQLMDAAAAGTLAYAHLTDYERGAYPLLPMGAHLALDALEGAAFLSAAWMLDEEPAPVRAALAGYGLFALSAALLTDHHAHGHPEEDAVRTGGGLRTRSGAWIMEDEEEEDTTMHLDPLTRGGQPEGRPRVAESEWRQAARGAARQQRTTDAAKAGTGSDAGAGDLRGREWQRARPDATTAQKAAAGRNTHQDGDTVGIDARRGYMAGAGI